MKCRHSREGTVSMVNIMHSVKKHKHSSCACSQDGTVYDVVNIVPYVMKYKRHPVTGQPLALKDLIKLNFHKNS
eukprot:scaffold104044_cov24-Tisochrysis_lutea.AAC.4